MRKMAVLAVMIFCIGVVDAGDINLKGTVKKENGEAVSEARVSLKNNPSAVSFTNDDGEFALSGTYTGDFQGDSLVVFTRGYRTVLHEIDSYQKDDIALVQKKSNPWIPSGPLQYWKSMVRIKAAGHDFEMGQPVDTARGSFVVEGEVQLSTQFEPPPHTVHFTYDFWMDTVEVRQGEYDTVMKSIYGEKYSKPAWGNGTGKNFPVYEIEWGSAALFCNARSKAHGLPDTAYSYSGISGNIGGLCELHDVQINLHANAYRLPTEAEWEYTYKAGTSTDFYWGKNYKPYPENLSDSNEINSYEVWAPISYNLGRDRVIRYGPGEDSSYYGAHEVAKKKPNNYGVYDMGGNLSEFCSDHEALYPWGEVTDPLQVFDFPGPRVRRGGNWSTSAGYLRATERIFGWADYPYFFIGLRCASSGDTTSGIKRTERFSYSKMTSISVLPGRIDCLNAAGSEITIYSLNGRKIYSVKPNNNRFSFKTDMLSGGSYIVKIKSGSETSRMITIVP